MKYDTAQNFNIVTWLHSKIADIRKKNLATQPSSYSTSNSGFTLIELLIVIGIIGLLTSISIAAYSTYTRNQKFTNAVNDIFNILQVAKSRASSQFIPTDICTVNTDADSSLGLKSYQVSITTASGITTVTLSVECTDSGGTLAARRVSDFTIKDIPITNDTVIFTIGDGGAGARKEIEIGTNQKKIVVEQNGKITIENN